MYTPKEYKITTLRECPSPDDMITCDAPGKAAAYWRAHVATAPGFNPEVETFVVILLNTRCKAKGHHVVSIGSLDQVLVQPREVFRAAIIGAAHGIIMMHNHPSGDSTPSEADIRVTRELVNAGRVIKIQVMDHVVVGHSTHRSLKECGHML